MVDLQSWQQVNRQEGGAETGRGEDARRRLLVWGLGVKKHPTQVQV